MRFAGRLRRSGAPQAGPIRVNAPARVHTWAMWTSRLLVLAVGLFAVGWGLLMLSGYRGPDDDYNLAAHAGGLMVYASVPTLALALVSGAAGALRWTARRLRHR